MPNIHSPSQQHYERLMYSEPIDRRGPVPQLPQFAKPQAPSYIMENWSQTRKMIMYDQLSNSEKGVMMNYSGRRDAALLKLFQDGSIPSDLFNSFRDDSPTGFKGDLLARYLKNNYVKGFDAAGIEDNDDLRKHIREDILVQKDHTEDVESRRTWGGVLGMVLGTVTGYASDPLLWPTLAIGYGEAALGMRALAHIGVATAAEAGMESVIQYRTHKWRKQVSEASLKESILSVLTVAGLTAGIGIGAKAMSYGMKKWAKARGIRAGKNSLTVRDWSEHKINQMMDEMDAAEFGAHLESRNIRASLKDTLVKQHAERSAAAEVAEGAERSAAAAVTEPAGEALEAGRLVRKGEAVQELKKGQVSAIVHNEDGSLELMLPDGDSVTIKLPTKEATDGFVEQYEKHVVTPEEAAAKKVVDKPKAKPEPEKKSLKKVSKNPEPIDSHEASVMLTKGLIREVEGEANTLLMLTKDGVVHRVYFPDVEARKAFEKKFESMAKPITALRHAEKIKAEEVRMNAIGADATVVEDIPDINKGSGGIDTPGSVAEGAAEGSAPKVVARTGKEELSDTLDLAVDDLLKKNPDLEIPVGREIIDGKPQAIMKKTKDIFKELDKNSELANLFKECIVGK